ncbi:hypothetical protein EYF80_014578 [Liparis tanakae]|uniref:Uncharacterized protein n=1 Tax=Liparis tanakae TaxID=230148 RepID=A0A4Z2IAY4_9TELE|nr:hypothetical protein EYF80_014578 [Liparis tanakae]
MCEGNDPRPRGETLNVSLSQQDVKVARARVWFGVVLLGASRRGPATWVLSGRFLWRDQDFTRRKAGQGGITAATHVERHVWVERKDSVILQHLQSCSAKCSGLPGLAPTVSSCSILTKQLPINCYLPGSLRASGERQEHRMERQDDKGVRRGRGEEKKQKGKRE